ncbi:MAG: rhodanese-like domain-containing protein [Candidatus Paceibacterota bacterium]|jgi:rhodanese-related sulfurtransferase
MDKNLTPLEAEEKIKAGGISVLDVRTPEEYAEGHIGGSLNMDVSEPSFAQGISVLDKNKEYLVYCRSGGRSSTAQEIMAKASFRNVYNLSGGIIAWNRRGLPIIK